MTKLALTFSCAGLADVDVTSKSDPQLYLFEFVEGEERVVVGKTERVKNCLDPHFKTVIKIDYTFEADILYQVVVYDVGKKEAADDQTIPTDILGSQQFYISVLANKQALSLPLVNQPSGGKGLVHIACQEQRARDFEVKLQLSGLHLDKKDLLGKSDPYFVISRHTDGANFVEAYRSEIIKNTLNPTWKPIAMLASALCGGDLDKSLRFQVFDWDKNSAHDLIGECTVSVLQLATPDAEFELINPAKQAAKPKAYKNSGVIKTLHGSVKQQTSFLDYLKAGFPINIMVGVDFTMSNQEIELMHSLHHFDSNESNLNAYQRAMTALVPILLSYSVYQNVLAYGFGAKLQKGSDVVSHCFPLTMDPATQQVNGLNGLLDAYKKAAHAVELFGPTNFAPIIEHAIAMAQNATEYLVVLMLTDGDISDMPQTIAAIVKASALPISIVIVGIGAEPFDQMKQLDCDKGMLMDRNGNKAVRDVVQFVPFRDFATDQTARRLTTATLGEIPQQFLSFMKLRDK